eukprot:Seg841.2 transcript_id=Seg841.2/GoldUCD/mRNA.D3Y31 product="Thioredoxin-related transmembrane protein 2" protein_id=Seg841.2/GoldUCD/D3Y31
MTTVGQTIKTLLTPYFILNVLSSVAYITTKYVKWTCERLYASDESCELDWRDQEILMFLCLFIVIKNRKWKPSQWTEYISNVFMLSKCANLLMFMRKNTMIGIAYAIFCLVLFLIVPEPRYSGPEEVKYFRGQALEEELATNKNTVYLVEFFASWSSPCSHFAPVFADVSMSFSDEYLKFGKLDIGRYPVVAERFKIDTSVRTKQLPTLILFVNGEEKIRKPSGDEHPKAWYYRFTKEHIVQDFNLTEYYEESKKKRKSSRNIDAKDSKEKED